MNGFKYDDEPMTHGSSTREITDNLLPVCRGVLGLTTSDSVRTDRLDALARSASLLETFVRGYESIDDAAISTDDEILNWAFSETFTDLSSAIWLLASGFYKASASSLRNAYDIATASLYFQIRENVNTEVGSYNRLFAEWDRGDRETPNWGEMKPIISSHPSVTAFKAEKGVDIVAHAYDHFKHLCSYTHTSAFAKNGDPVTAINTTGVAPAFDAVCFDRGCELTRKTISLIAILWQVVFPQIAATEPLGAIAKGTYDDLFLPPHGPSVLAHEHPKVV